ncbi:MAG TPA: cytochrome c biogenesis protein CcdA [Mycobacteriales bacterium]
MIADTILDGSLLAAVPLAFLAGLVSFLSPCVLPLVPGYLAYITGLTGADLTEATATSRQRSRVVLGALLFVLGFTAVFMTVGALFGAAGRVLSEHQEGITQALGAVTIVLGLVFMGALSRVSFLSRDFRVHALPRAGLGGAPLLGALFGLGWTPCAGPTLGAVLTLAVSTGTAVRGAFLVLVYCLGLGLPFVLAGLAFERSMAAFAVVKRHYGLVTRLGGGFLVLIGVLLVTGEWTRIVARMQVWIGGFETAL